MEDTLQSISLSFYDGKWKKKIKKLIKEQIAPLAKEIDKTGRFPKENLELLGEQQFLGLGIPEELGGVGGNIKTTNTVIEELGKACPSTAMAYLMHISLVPILTKLATPAQFEKYIKPIIKGESFGSYSMSEKGTGSRLWHMDSFAVDLGENYLINSFKSFATSSEACNFYLLAVKSSEQAKPNELNIFMVDAKDPNVKIIGEWDAMGLKGTSSTPVHFNNCLVDKSRQFGPDNCGYNLIMAYTFPPYVIGLSTVYLGIAKRAFEAAQESVMKRSYTDGSDKSELRQVESIQRYLAEMKVKIDMVSAQIDRVVKLAAAVTKVFDQLLEVEMLDELLENAQKDDFFLSLAQTKIAACEMVVEVTNIAMQVCGGTGFKSGSIVEQCYRDARAGSVMGPSDDILKVLIGKRLLGLPFPWNE